MEPQLRTLVSPYPSYYTEWAVPVTIDLEAHKENNLYETTQALCCGWETGAIKNDEEKQ